jgi:hypothetical protein
VVLWQLSDNNLAENDTKHSIAALKWRVK